MKRERCVNIPLWCRAVWDGDQLYYLKITVLVKVDGYFFLSFLSNFTISAIKAMVNIPNPRIVWIVSYADKRPTPFIDFSTYIHKHHHRKGKASAPTLLTSLRFSSQSACSCALAAAITSLHLDYTMWNKKIISFQYIFLGNCAIMVMKRELCANIPLWCRAVTNGDKN